MVRTRYSNVLEVLEQEQLQSPFLTPGATDWNVNGLGSGQLACPSNWTAKMPAT